MYAWNCNKLTGTDPDSPADRFPYTEKTYNNPQSLWIFA
jgi:hypothetical protein